MNEQQNNTIEDSITIGDIFSALFCKKLIMLIITLHYYGERKFYKL